MVTPKIIPTWRRAWRYFTVHVGIVAVTFGLMPPDVQASVLQAVGVPANRVPALLGVLFIVGRLWHQPTPEPAPEPPDQTGGDS